MIYRNIQFQPRTWQGRIGVILAAALGVGLLVAFVILTLGVAILLLPVIAVLAVIGWWRWRKIEAAMRKQARAGPKGDRTIETDYEVIRSRDEIRRG